jgi:hypothetical protein
MRAAGLLIAIVAVSGCLLPARQFSLTLDGKGVVDDLPVTVEDRSGQLLAVAAALPGQFNLEAGVAGGGEPSDIVITWMGGQCDDRAHVAVDAKNGIYTIVETTESARSCTLGGFLRTVTLRFSGPVRPGSVTFEHETVAR